MHRRRVADTAWLVVDTTVGLGAEAVRTGGWVAGTVSRTLRPVTDLAARPPLLPERYWPARLLSGLAAEGRRQRRDVTRAARQLLRRSVPVATADVLDQLNLTELIRARVDLVGLARYVAAGLDRAEDTGEPVGKLEAAARGAQPQSGETDPEAIAEWVDRVFRTGRPATGPAGSEDDDEPPDRAAPGER